MSDLQQWFAPLLWVLGTITALIAFVRLCKPIWRVFQAPNDFDSSIKNLDEKMSAHFADINLRLDRHDINLQELKDNDILINEAQITVLRDRIGQAYHHYASLGDLSTEVYQALCDMYKVYHKMGGNSYIDAIMPRIHDLYNASILKNSEKDQKGE